jgi:hypothetical protein
MSRTRLLIYGIRHLWAAFTFAPYWPRDRYGIRYAERSADERYIEGLIVWIGALLIAFIISTA